MADSVVAVARNRGIDVIANETSNRATPSLVSFSDKQRFLGEGAKNMEVSNFKNTVCSLKRLAGKKFADSQVQIEKPFVNSRITGTPSGEAGCAVSFLNDEKEFTYTQLCSMFLVKVKEFTSKELKAPVSDCVISCPTWFTDIQRRALLDAAQVAGLNCLRLMNDTSAAALGYGITKTDLPDPENKEKPRNVCFVDLGHSSYQVAIVSFVKGKLTIRGTACDPNLGGRDYDQVLVKHYAEEFKQKYKIDIASNAKATFRLRQGAEKVKKILSANPTAALNVECIMDDKDVSAQVQRDDFLEWARPLSERLLQPITDALAAAGMKPEEVDFVELVGGSTRLPVVKETLATYFGGSLEGSNKLSTTLNQDEAVARGCALQCAILSPAFKVRDFSVTDWNGMSMELTWNACDMPPAKAGEKLITEMEAFSIGNPIPSSKILTFVRELKADEVAAGNGEVTLEIKGKYTKGPEIGSWVINGIKQLLSTENKDANGNTLSAKAAIKVKAKLDGNGLLSLESANQIEEVIVPVEEKEEGKDKAAEGKTKKMLKRHDLTITANLASASPATIQQWLADEGSMYAADRLVIDTADRRNALEEYVYETRSKLEMAWSEYVVDSERAAFYKTLNETEDWLYGEGEDATKSVYVEKLAELTKIGDPIAVRAQQAEERPYAEKALREYVNTIIIEVQSGVSVI
jgi:heat shock 70kDa protein 4